MGSTHHPRLRQLPPSAVPVSAADLRAGLGTGPQTHEAFRAALAQYLGLPAAAVRLAASGRTALYMLLRGLQQEEPLRTEVVMPAYTCPSVPKVVRDLGLQPVYADIIPQTMRFEPASLAAATRAQTLAICLIHPFGLPQPVEDALPLARRHGAVLIEDAAQALGSGWHGRSVGLAGDFGLFSLGPGKPLSTGGGGVLVTGHASWVPALSRWWAELPAASGSAAAQAWARQVAFQAAFQPRSWWAATRLGLQRLGNHEASWGYRVRDLSSAQAGVGLALLPRLEAINEARRRTAVPLQAFVKQAGGLENIAVTAGADPIYLRLPLLAQDYEQREALFARLWGAGIGVGRMYERPLSQIFPQGAEQFPGAEAFARRLLTLPTHYQVKPDDIARMGAILTED